MAKATCVRRDVLRGNGSPTLPGTSQGMRARPTQTCGCGVLFQCFQLHLVCDTVGGLESCRQQRASARQACETEPGFARCTLLPVAVAAAHVAARSGTPSAFFVDMMLACLSSCVHLLAGLQPHPSTDPSFVVRARFSAMIAGDPNAGKSPTHSWLLGLLTWFMKANKDFSLG